MGKLAPTLLAIVFMTVACMTLMQLFVPLIQKIKLDQAIRDVVYEANVSNGLSNDRMADLKKELEAIGLESVVITAPGVAEVGRFEAKPIVVSGNYRLRHFVSLWTSRQELWPYRFEGRIYGKHIIN